MACNATTVLAAAMAAGYAKLSERDLMACQLAAACQGSSSGGGGGGVVPGGGPPVAPPAAGAGLYYDTTNFALYLWNNVTNNWDKLIG